MDWSIKARMLSKKTPGCWNRKAAGVIYEVKWRQTRGGRNQQWLWSWLQMVWRVKREVKEQKKHMGDGTREREWWKVLGTVSPSLSHPNALQPSPWGSAANGFTLWETSVLYGMLQYSLECTCSLYGENCMCHVCSIYTHLELSSNDNLQSFSNEY